MSGTWEPKQEYESSVLCLIKHSLLIKMRKIESESEHVAGVVVIINYGVCLHIPIDFLMDSVFF